MRSPCARPAAVGVPTQCAERVSLAQSPPGALLRVLPPSPKRRPHPPNSADDHSKARVSACFCLFPTGSTDPTGLCELAGEPTLSEFDRRCKYYPNIAGGVWGYKFSFLAEFEEPCDCCEYRQFINCDVQNRRFADGVWSDWNVSRVYGEPHEDKNPDGRRYGYRANEPKWYDRYLPDQENGCIYQNTDAPGYGGLKDYFRSRPQVEKLEIEVSCRVILSIVEVPTENVIYTKILDFRCSGILNRATVIPGRPRVGR